MPKDMCNHDYRIAGIVHGVPRYECTVCGDGYQVRFLTELESLLVKILEMDVRAMKMRERAEKTMRACGCV